MVEDIVRRIIEIITQRRFSGMYISMGMTAPNGANRQTGRVTRTVR